VTALQYLLETRVLKKRYEADRRHKERQVSVASGYCGFVSSSTRLGSILCVTTKDSLWNSYYG